MNKVSPYMFGIHEEKVVKQLENCMIKGIVRAAVLCADAHFGYSMPIGGVTAYNGFIAPACVGFDIACGNKAVKTDAKWNDVRNNIAKIMDDIYSHIEFGIGRKDGSNLNHPVLEDALWNSVPKWVAELKSFAAQQLGTVGAGNHYVDIFRDEDDIIWIGAHFGSRGFGHKIASGFLNIAAGKKYDEGRPKDLSMAVPDLLKLDSDSGENYWNSMMLAGKYAYAGRDIVCEKVLEILGARKTDEVHNHHNFAWKERHGNWDGIVIRKGATPAFPGQRSFVGSTMGEISVILEGVDSLISRNALYSTMHGAGRVMSRNKAAGTWKRIKKRGRIRAGGVVNWNKVKRMMKEKGIELRGGAPDEAPEVYKRLDEVLELHKGTIKILHRLIPVGVAMAGEDIFDPYKD